MDDRYSAAEREAFELDEYVRWPSIHSPAYLFDTLGYIKIEGVLSAQEVARLNGAFDHFEPTMQPSPNYADGALSPRIASPDGPDSPSRMDLAQNPLQWPQPYCEPVRECLCHPNVVPYLNLILGKGYRLDHGPSLFLHRKGFAGQTLHGGGTSRADFSEQYMFKAGRIYSGLIVCEFFLADEPLGAGGLAIVPGSHKSELPLPSSLSRMEKHAHVVAEIAARAGDVVIFTETATHGALTWTAEHDRRALAFKFSPGFSAYAAASSGPSHTVVYPGWVAELKPEQRAVLHAPFLADGNQTNPQEHGALRRSSKL